MYATCPYLYITIHQRDAIFQVAPRCWFVKLIDKDNQKFDFKISCPIGFLFDVIFMVLVDKSDSSSINIFMNTCQEELTISLNNNYIQKNSFIVCVYGLKTVISSTEQYDRIVCCGNKEIVCPVNIQVTVLLEQYEEELHTLPLSSTETQGTLPVTIHRQPPSLYRLDVNLMFTSGKDFIVFVRAKKQLRCFIVSGRCFNNMFPFEFPSASSVEFFSLLDTYRLYNLAVAFGTRKVFPNMRPIQYFYRNKSKTYFDKIMKQMNGEMRPYLKSNGGEQSSVVNGRLSGLFFSTYIDATTNMPSPFSHFGPIRLYIQSLVMFNPECNLYFADFYCHKKRHHVTIILMPKYSIDNEFCGQYLKELNIFHNPYLCLRVEFNGAFTVMANLDVTVEVFYTETINVRRALELQYGFIEKTNTIGRGYAPPSGIPKNPSCKICNLE
ncbi:unnamed protein product [Mytilus coruscus]|uniref:Phytanoyl-CoA hydroxylase-interacting protein-like C-terminal domain-containing protein n=1 Tax=Mytilus coruscus TaxID=42192 RepID=A0A6J8DAH4_MYTCO|nr:unnamed protein product [Mytilus coruscus]